MKIAIDARAFGWPGLGRYTRSLLAALSRQKADHWYIIMVTRADRGEFEVFRRQNLNSQFSVVTVDGEYYSLREQTVFWRQAQKILADLFHFTHFNVPVLFSKPYVVTVHDVTRFLFPGQKKQGLAKQIVYEWVFQRAIQKARAVIAVSETTASEFKKERLQVVHEGVDEFFFQPVAAGQRNKVRALLGTQAPYVLYVGVWMSHKNLPRLLATFSEVRKKMPELRLVLIGKPKPGYINMMKLVEKAGVTKNVIFPGFVPEDLLPALYREAKCVFLPSLYEGFGLPALEAAAAGAPVVTSNVAGSAEIMDGTAQLVNPEYVPGMTRALLEVLQNEDLRRDLIARGRDRAAQFSWDECARKTLEMYEGAVIGLVG